MGKISEEEKSSIYQITCKDYHERYIGQTKNKLNTTEKRNFQNIRYQHVDKSTPPLQVWFGQKTTNYKKGENY